MIRRLKLKNYIEVSEPTEEQQQSGTNENSYASIKIPKIELEKLGIKINNSKFQKESRSVNKKKSNSDHVQTYQNTSVINTINEVNESMNDPYQVAVGRKLEIGPGRNNHIRFGGRSNSVQQ